jgi:glyceraldehyde-3-phosphate dehydrogenase/erythrose-4-phosphate dehydrogenase
MHSILPRTAGLVRISSSVSIAVSPHPETIAHLLKHDSVYGRSPYSAIFDAPQTSVIDETLKVVAWYNNEWGYSTRLVELAVRVAAAERVPA